MVKTNKMLPVGVDDFETLIRQNFYYFDKTAFIQRLIHWHGAVNFFTRPRRFGKTLNMGMLRAFFEIGTKRSREYEDLEKDSEEALRQIEDRGYAWSFLRKKYHVIAYGISFEGKECFVKVKQL